MCAEFGRGAPAAVETALRARFRPSFSTRLKGNKQAVAHKPQTQSLKVCSDGTDEKG